MAAEREPDPQITLIDKALAEWRQGDCALGEHRFVHRIDPSVPVTDAGLDASKGGADLAEQEVPGFVVVTQTCDVVRSCAERPFVEICPLVEVDDDRLREIQRGRRPTYAFVPLLSASKLVADLDRVMTVEKPLVANWKRNQGGLPMQKPEPSRLRYRANVFASRSRTISRHLRRSCTIVWRTSTRRAPTRAVAFDLFARSVFTPRLRGTHLKSTSSSGSSAMKVMWTSRARTGRTY